MKQVDEERLNDVRSLFAVLDRDQKGSVSMEDLEHMEVFFLRSLTREPP